MHISIYSHGQRLHLLPWFEFQRAVDSGKIESVEYYRYPDEQSARRFFSRHFQDSHEIVGLRDALAQEGYDMTRLSHAAVMDMAARRLCEGTWRIGCDCTVDKDTVVGKVAQKTVAASDRRDIASPFSPRSLAARAARAPAAARVAPVQVEAVVEPAVPEWTDDIDQIAFADVLEAGARNSKPFCEICERMKRQSAGMTG